MAQALNDPLYWENRRRHWIDRVQALVNQIAEWAAAEDWAVARGTRTLHESGVGEYVIPTLRVRLPAGELHVNPAGLRIIGADGRVDLEAFPTLNRVKLIGRDNQWHIVTDSNVPLRQLWTRETFVQLAHDLLA